MAIDNIACGESVEKWVGVTNELVNKANYSPVFETLVFANSTATSQEPTGLDTPLQIEFGAAQGSVTDPIMLATDGTVTANEAGSFVFFYNVTFGRLGNAGEAELRFAITIDGVQIGRVLAIKIDSIKIQAPINLSFSLNLEAGNVVKTFMLRDSTGVDEGGLYENPTTFAGWPNSSCAELSIDRLV